MILAEGAPSLMVRIAMVQCGWRRRSIALPGLSSIRPSTSSSQGMCEWPKTTIRGSAVPFLFLLAGFLVSLSVEAGAVLSKASSDMLHKTIKATVRQWNDRIDHARKQGLDLSPVAVALFIDAGDNDGARRIQLIADGLAQAEGRTISERA